MRKDLHTTWQHATLTWVTLFVEILTATILYASLYTLGMSKSTALSVSSITAIMLVFLGLLFNYKVFPKLVKSPKRKGASIINYSLGERIYTTFSALLQTVGLLATILTFLGAGSLVFGYANRLLPLIVIGIAIFCLSIFFFITLYTFSEEESKEKQPAYYSLVGINKAMNIKARPQVIVEALKVGVDALAQAPYKRKEVELEIQEKELELRLKEQEVNLEQEKAVQNAELEEQKIQLGIEKQQIEIERQLLKLMQERNELELKKIKFALETARKMIDVLAPNADNTTKATLVNTLLPSLLQLSNGKGLELILPTPKDKETE